MRRFVNGREVELDGYAEVVETSDRLMVRTPEGSFSAVAVRQGDQVLVSYKGRQFTIEKKVPRARAAGAAGSGELRAPMPGLIVDVLVSEGQAVEKGQKLLVLEAMKTQQPFVAPFDGVVQSLAAVKGEQVVEGAVLAVVVEATRLADSQP